MIVRLAVDDWRDKQLVAQHEFISKVPAVANLFMRKGHKQGPDQGQAVLGLAAEGIKVRLQLLTQAKVGLHYPGDLVVEGERRLAEGALVVNSEEKRGKGLPFQVADGNLSIFLAVLAAGSGPDEGQARQTST